MSDKLTEKDMNYLRNIDTRPGPNAGESIDPTKPGPTADREARSTLLAQIDRLFEETERDYVPDVSAIDVRLSFQTRPRYRTLAEIRQAIRALALPDSPTTHKGGE